MHLPQFTAEVALRRTRGNYASNSAVTNFADGGRVFPQFLPHGGWGGPWIPSYCYDNPGALGCPAPPRLVCDGAGHCIVPITTVM